MGRASAKGKARAAALAAALAIPGVLLPTSSAQACDRQPCKPVCNVNEPSVSVSPGDPNVGVGIPDRPIDCYY